MAGTEEEGAGAGEGDVPQAQFLGVLVLAHVGLERGEGLGVPGVDRRERGGVAAQGVREDLRLGGPRLARACAGELAGDQAGDGDDVPLQALGLVGGEDLDGVLAAGQGAVEALLELDGRAQEAEEGEEGGLAVEGGEAGGDVEEVAEGLAAAGGEGVRGGGELDLQAGGGEDPVQYVHEGVGERGAQGAQFGGEAGEADLGLGGEREAVVGGAAGVEEGVERVGEGDHLGRVDALDGGGEPLLGVGLLAPPVDQEAGATAEEGEVAGADPPAGAGEEPYQGGVGARVLEDLADGDEVGDLGQVEEAGEADDLDGHVPGDEGGVDRGEVGGGAAQDGDLAGFAAGADEVGEGVREPVDLLGVGGQQGDPYGAVVLGAGCGPQRLHARVHGAQGGGEAVGEVQEAAAAAPVLGEGVAARGAAVAVREVLGEVVQVGDGGAAPAVDGLAGVADGGHGVSGALAEEAGEQQPLGDGGVLVLVEEDDLELVAQDRADLGPGGGEFGGAGDLVTEVEQVAGALGGAVADDEVEEFAAGGGGLGGLAQLGVAEFGAREDGEQVGVVRAEPVGRDEVLGEFGVEGEQVGDEGREGPGERRVRAGGLAEHARGELVAGGVGEEPGGGLQADAEAVVGEELSGEGVVGGDAGLAGRVVGVDDVGVGDAGADEGGADALGEFAGGLVGEGEAEDLLGSDLARADEPDHAGGHHRRLAGAGAGHDDLRGERRGDAGRLLRGERDAEQLLELLGVADACGHRKRLAGRSDSAGRERVPVPGVPGFPVPGVTAARRRELRASAVGSSGEGHRRPRAPCPRA